MHKFDFRISDNRTQSWWEVGEKERACACICVCGEKRAWELTQQASEESQVQEKSRMHMADAAAGERCKLPRVEEQDGQFSMDVTFPAKAWCHGAGKWCKSSAEQLSSIQCAAVGQSILADLKLQGSEVRNGGNTPSIQVWLGKGVPWSHFPHRQSQVLSTLMTFGHKPDGTGLPGGPSAPAWWLLWLTVKVWQHLVAEM